MKSEIEVINPLSYPDWDDWIGILEGSTCFHSLGWAEVLHHTYGFNPLYFAVKSAANPVALVPIMEIRSWITGRRAVSLPFSDYCDPLVTSRASLKDVLSRLIEYGKKSKWKYIEFRGGKFDDERYQSSCYYYKHRFDLDMGHQAIISKSRHSTRSNINKAVSKGVEISFSTDEAVMESFYHLQCLTRKRHGVPPQPLSFFRNVYKYIIAKNKGEIAVATYENKIVAMAVVLFFAKDVVYKYNSSDLRFQQLRANNLLLSEMLNRYIEKGYRSFCFGRTEAGNEGLLQFKRGWAAEETRINYYRFNLMQNVILEKPLAVPPVIQSVIKRLPTPLLKLSGSILYKHFA